MAYDTRSVEKFKFIYFSDHKVRVLNNYST